MSELPAFIPNKLLYRKDEVAGYIGKSVRTVERLINSGAFGDIWKRDKAPMMITRHGLEYFYEANQVEPGR